MYKIVMLFGLACLAFAGDAVAKESVFILVAHPDDTLACAGTMFLLKDKFDLHVMVWRRGSPSTMSSPREVGAFSANYRIFRVRNRLG